MQAVLKAASVLALAGILVCLPVYAGASFSAQADTTTPPKVDPKDARRAYDSARRSLDLQTEFPLPPPEKRRSKDRGMHIENGHAREPFLSESFARVLLWIAVAVLVFVLLFSLKDSFLNASRSRRLKQGEDDDYEATQAAAARMDKAQMAADELANQGSFAEAMHILLLQSVSELRRRLDISIASSLTSREILHRVGLSPEGRDFFADIVGSVEISYFGPHEPSEEEYLACRKNYEGLTLALQRGRAR